MNRTIGFKIEITRIDEVGVTSRDWEKQADSGNEKDGGAVYGYATYDSTQRRDVAIFEQVVNSLDLIAVICAVNGIKQETADA